MKTTLHITLAGLRKHDACEEGYDRLVARLGADWPDDKPINLLSCLESNPVGDVIWALRATEEDCEYVARMIAADCAESVLHLYEAEYPDDRRPRKAIEAARAFARGEIDEQAREAAARAAWNAALTARCDVTSAAALSASGCASGDVAWNAAWNAALAAERERQPDILRKWLS